MTENNTPQQSLLGNVPAAAAHVRALQQQRDIAEPTSHAQRVSTELGAQRPLVAKAHPPWFVLVSLLVDCVSVVVGVGLM